MEAEGIGSGRGDAGKTAPTQADGLGDVVGSALQAKDPQE